MSESKNPSGSTAEAEPPRRRLAGRIRALEAELARLRAEGAEDLEACEQSHQQGSDGPPSFRDIADASPAMLWITDRENSCTFLSRYWYEYTGQVEGEGHGSGWLDAVHPEDRDEAGRAFLAAAAKRSPFSLDHRLRRRDGEYRWVMDEGRPQFDEDGNWRGYVGLVIDVHERRLAREAAQRSEAQYRELFEAIDSGFCVLEVLFDAEGTAYDYRFIEMNPAFRRHTGLENAVGRTARELLPDLEEHWFRIYGEVARTGTPIRFEDRSDVMQRWFDVYAFPAENHGSDRVALRFTDVSAQKRAEQALQRSVEQLRSMTRASLEIHSSQGVAERLRIIADQSRLLIGTHQAVTSMTIDGEWSEAISAVSLSERYATWRDYDSAPDAAAIHRAVSVNARPVRLVREELEEHPEWSGLSEETPGRPPLRGLLAVPLVGRDGAELGLIHLSDKESGDFTEADEAVLVQLAHLAAIAIENAHLYSEAQRANRVKSEFLASMSHELRTPLNAIGGYVDLLDLEIHGPLTEAQRNAIGRITANQRHLLALINDILSFARLEAGRIVPDARVLSARELLDEVEPLVAPQAAAKSIEYSLAPCDPEVLFIGDAERVRQVLLNLVGNAIKFTPAGGAVRVSCEEGADHVDFLVEDNGVGISREEQESIFDPFQQVGRRLNQPREGVGLGLAISRDLARAMGGDLLVRSTPGEGSTFTLRMKRAETA